MKKESLFIVLLLAFASLAFSQEPTASGSIADMADMHNCYLAADTSEARARLIKELKKQYPDLRIVGSPNEAQFFLEYKVLRIESDNDPTAPVTYSEMAAYTMTDNRRVIAWSDKEDDEGISRKNEINLVRNFVKALNKARVIGTHK